jgi:hypothetical protein
MKRVERNHLAVVLEAILDETSLDFAASGEKPVRVRFS